MLPNTARFLLGWLSYLLLIVVTGAVLHHVTVAQRIGWRIPALFVSYGLLFHVTPAIWVSHDAARIGDPELQSYSSGIHILKRGLAAVFLRYLPARRKALSKASTRPT